MIDPNIALSFRTPQMEGPAEQYGRVLSLKAMIDEQKMRKMQTQQAEEAQRELSAFNKALQENTSIDETGSPKINHAGVMQSLARAGAGRQLMDYQTNLSKLTAQELEQETKQRSLFATKAARLGQIAQSAVDQESYQAAVSQAVDEKLMAPDMLKQLPPDFTKAQPMLQQFVAQSMDAEKYLSYQSQMATKAFNEKMRPIQERKAIADAQVSEQESAGTRPITPYQQAQLSQQRATLEQQRGRRTEAEWTALAAQGDPVAKKVMAEFAAQKGREATATKAAQSGGIGTGAVYTGAAAGVPIEHNEEVLKGLPVGEVNIIKGMIDGRIAMPGGMAAGKEPWVSRLSKAAEYEPGFDQSQWRTRLDTRVDFAKGKAALQIRSLNTLIKHLSDLWDASDSLDNTGLTGGTKVGSYLVNLGKEQFGSEALKKWDTAATAAGSEMAAILKGAAPTDQEMEEQKKIFNRNDPQTAQKQAIKSTLKLAFGRLQAVRDQYEQAFKKQKDFKFLTPKSEQISKDKLGVDPNEVEGGTPGEVKTQPQTASGLVQVTDPRGVVHSFRTQQEADLFKRAAGIK